MKWIVAALVIWLAWRFLARKPPMAVTEEGRARALLGVKPGADEDAVRAAHRRKVAAAHPDRGGSDELTGRLNAARDLLLRRPG